MPLKRKVNTIIESVLLTRGINEQSNLRYIFVVAEMVLYTVKGKTIIIICVNVLLPHNANKYIQASIKISWQ